MSSPGSETGSGASDDRGRGFRGRHRPGSNDPRADGRDHWRQDDVTPSNRRPLDPRYRPNPGSRPGPEYSSRRDDRSSGNGRGAGLTRPLRNLWPFRGAGSAAGDDPRAGNGYGPPRDYPARNGRPAVNDYRPPPADYRPPPSDYRPPPSDYRRSRNDPTVPHRRPDARPAESYGPPASGYGTDDVRTRPTPGGHPPGSHRP